MHIRDEVELRVYGIKVPDYDVNMVARAIIAIDNAERKLHRMMSNYDPDNHPYPKAICDCDDCTNPDRT